MINTTTAILVALFFFHGAIASFISGSYFWAKKDHTVKFFGMGLIFNALAFTTWALLAANRLNNLRILAALAAVFLILGLFSFFLSSVQHLQATTSYSAALIVGAIGALGLFVLRTFVYPSHLVVSGRGFLLFDLDTVVKVAYIFAISATILPAANAVAGKFKKTVLSPLIKGCFTTLAIGGIILATSSDTSLILLDGIAMSVAFLLLWVTLLTGGHKALHKVS